VVELEKVNLDSAATAEAGEVPAKTPQVKESELS